MKLIKRAVFLLLTAMVLFIPASAIAEDASPTVKEKSEYVGRILLEDKKFPMEHYKIETQVDDGLKATGDRALAGLNSGLWSINKEIAKFTIFAVEQLMTFDLISQIVDDVSILSSRIFNAMSGAFLGLFVTIAGGVAAYRYFVNQQTASAVKALIGVVLILTVTMWFFNDTKGNITWMNEISSDLEGIASSTNVLLTSDGFNSNKPYDEQEGTAILRNQLFNLMVKQPYLFLNYGTTKESKVNKEDPNRMDNLLALKPYSEEGKDKRTEIVNNEVDKLENLQMTTDYSGERFGKIFLTIISTVAIAIPVIMEAGLKFMVQLFLLAAVIFTGIPLTMSLIPTYSETALKHFKHLVSLILYKAALVLLIAVSTGIATIIYEGMKVSDGLEGYMLVVFITVLVMWGLYKYRSQILEVVSVGFIQGNHAAERISQSATSLVTQSAGKGVNLTKRVTEGGFRAVDAFAASQKEAAYQERSKQGRHLTAISGGNENSHSSKRKENAIDQSKGNRSSQRFSSSNSSDKEPGLVNSSRSQKNAGEAKISGNETTNNENRMTEKGQSANVSEKRKADYRPAARRRATAGKQNVSAQRKHSHSEPARSEQQAITEGRKQAASSIERQTAAQKSPLRSSENQRKHSHSEPARSEQQAITEGRKQAASSIEPQTAAQKSPLRSSENIRAINTLPKQEKAAIRQEQPKKERSEMRKEPTKETAAVKRMKIK